MKKLILLAFSIMLVAGPSAAQQVSDEDLATRPATVKKLVSGQTIRTYTRNHGNRIEYFAPNGKVYVWPARMQMITGTWKTCTKTAKLADPKTQKVKDLKLAAICRKLPTSTAPDQTWDSIWATYKYNIREQVAGDLFKLSTRTGAPYALGKRDEGFAYYVKKVEKADAKAAKKAAKNK